MITYGEAPFGEISGSSGSSGDTATPYINIEWDGFDGFVSQPFVQLYWDGFIEATPQVNIEWGLETETPSVPIKWTVTETDTPQVNISWVAPDVSTYPDTTEQWSLDVIIGGTSYAARLTGQASIDYEENSSGLADFTIIPTSGSVDPMSWIGKQVFIDVTAGSNTVRRFNGFVSNAVYDSNTGTMDFSCTSDLQGYFENLERSDIDTIVGGYWSDKVFNDQGDQSDGWTYAQDRLSTQFKAIHHNINRQPVLTSLEAKTTPDFTFTDADRYDADIELTRATRRDLLNRIRMQFDFRFTRLRQREINYNFQWINEYDQDVLSWCDYLTYAYDLCERALVESAIENTGWSVMGNVNYTTVPDSGQFDCSSFLPFRPWVPQGGLNLNWVTNDTLQESVCLSATWRMAKRFAQTVTEQYTFDIRANDSIEYVGELGLEQRFGMQREYDATEWESEPFDSVESGATVEASGDYILDIDTGDNGRTEFETAQQCALAQAVNSIKKSHRENTVSFVAPFHPTVDLTHTVQVTNAYITAKGKVRQIVDRFNIDSGDADTTISLAISRHGGSGLASDTALDPVTAPTYDPPAYTVDYNLYYHIGNQAVAAPYSDAWDGFTTNRLAYQGGGYEIYPVDFKITTPEIDSAYRDAVDATATNTINVKIIEDTLTLTA